MHEYTSIHIHTRTHATYAFTKSHAYTQTTQIDTKQAHTEKHKLTLIHIEKHACSHTCSHRHTHKHTHKYTNIHQPTRLGL